MKLVLLGTGGYYPTDRRHTACMMLPEIGVVLDAGSGMCSLREYVSSDRLDIFLTHAHLDHICGLTYLVNLLPAELVARTTVHGEAAKLTAVREHLFAELIFPVRPTFQFQALAGDWPLQGGGRLSYFSLDHPGGSLGYRLDWPDRSLAYITDTTAAIDAEYVAKIRGVDLLLHEANFPQDIRGLPAISGHSCLESVAEVAAAADVGRLVLVHTDPQVDDGAYDLAAGRRRFKHLELGTDLMELDF